IDRQLVQNDLIDLGRRRKSVDDGKAAEEIAEFPAFLSRGSGKAVEDSRQAFQLLFSQRGLVVHLPQGGVDLFFDFSLGVVQALVGLIQFGLDSLQVLVHLGQLVLLYFLLGFAIGRADMLGLDVAVAHGGVVFRLQFLVLGLFLVLASQDTAIFLVKAFFL